MEEFQRLERENKTNEDADMSDTSAEQDNLDDRELE